jgi:hypothetical protein
MEVDAPDPLGRVRTI